MGVYNTAQKCDENCDIYKEHRIARFLLTFAKNTLRNPTLTSSVNLSSVHPLIDDGATFV